MRQVAECSKKELRRLGRRDLLVLMLDQARQIEDLERTLAETQERCAQRAEEQRQIAEARIALLEEKLAHAQTGRKPAPPAASSPQSPHSMAGKIKELCKAAFQKGGCL